jgi:hypothetical protein
MAAFAFIVFPFVAFLIYDTIVSRQQKQMLSSVQRSDAIISDLFPSHIRDQLYRPKDGDDVQKSSLAELYPETSVMFAGKDLKDTILLFVINMIVLNLIVCDCKLS